MPTSAAAELEDFHRLVQKAHTLGVLPALVIDVPATGSSENSPRQLIDDETAGLAALHAVIPLTGQGLGSEALEHLVEHILYRKQEQRLPSEEDATRSPPETLPPEAPRSPSVSLTDVYETRTGNPSNLSGGPRE